MARDPDASLVRSAKVVELVRVVSVVGAGTNVSPIHEIIDYYHPQTGELVATGLRPDLA